MKQKRMWLALALIAVGVLVFLYGLFAPALLAQNDYLAYYNEGVIRFERSAALDKDEEFILAQDKFREALLNDPPSKARAAILYNIATASLKNMQRTSSITMNEIEAVISNLKEAGRYDGYDMDLKYNLDVLLGIKALALKGLGEDGASGDIEPLPNFGQDPSSAKDGEAEKYKMGNNPDEGVGREPGGAGSGPDF